MTHPPEEPIRGTGLIAQARLYAEVVTATAQTLRVPLQWLGTDCGICGRSLTVKRLAVTVVNDARRGYQIMAVCRDHAEQG